MAYPEEIIFNRSRRLLGDEAMERLAGARVAVFGVGGVGSWAAEALVRTGLGHLTIVDADRVSPTNINRQAEAWQGTVGEVKVEAMRRQLLDINPQADIEAVERVYTSATADTFDLENYDFIIDAIDSLADKALLILRATAARRPGFASSMGAALKSDPTKISVAEFWKVEGCPLGAALRRRFRKSGQFPHRKFPCVYSPELLPNLGPATQQPGGAEATQPNGETTAAEPFAETAMSFGKVAVNGSLCHITGIFGFTLAGLALRSLLK